MQVICRLQGFQGSLLDSAISHAVRNRPWRDPHYGPPRRNRGPSPTSCGDNLLHPVALSRRERELLLLVGQGYNAQEISRHLSIRCDSVRHTLIRVYKRIGVRDRAQAVGWCLCHGLISRHDLRRRYPLVKAPQGPAVDAAAVGRPAAGRIA